MACQVQSVNLPVPSSAPAQAPMPATNNELPGIFSGLPVSSRASRSQSPVTHVDVDTVVSRELDLDRLNALQSGLWYAGRPYAASPLHKQVSVNRHIVITEELDMHLVWGNQKIFIKPLPGYLLQSKFWEIYLTCGGACPSCLMGQASTVPPGSESKECIRAKNRRAALGFLFSYACLITYESDYHIAQQHHLLPEIKNGEAGSWRDWRSIMERILDSHDIANVNPRFLHGELRLSRLNILSFYHYRRTYHRRYVTYRHFVSDNFAWIAAGLVYVAVALSAMQVGLTTDALRDDEAFNRGSRGFALFAIFGPMAAAGVLSIALLVDAFINTISARAEMADAWQVLQGH